MKKRICISMVIFSLIFFAKISLAEISSTELIEKGKEYDGQIVTYTGEVIGDPMSRGAYVWLNVKDKDNALGIWVKKELLPKIKYFGFYGSIGDMLVIQGTFHRSCIEHGGDMDIHVTSIIITKEGHPVKHNVKLYQFILAAFTLFTAGISYFLYRFKKNDLN